MVITKKNYNDKIDKSVETMIDYDLLAFNHEDIP